MMLLVSIIIIVVGINYTHIHSFVYLLHFNKKNYVILPSHYLLASRASFNKIHIHLSYLQEVGKQVI